MLTRSSLTIRLHPNDDVVIARSQLVGGTLLDEKVTVSGLVPPGHKVAHARPQAGEPVRRYNQIIGFAAATSRRASTCTCTTWRWAISTVTTRSAPT